MRDDPETWHAGTYQVLRWQLHLTASVLYKMKKKVQAALPLPL